MSIGIPAVIIINITIVIIINTITRDFIGIFEKVDIGMSQIKTPINNSNHNLITIDGTTAGSKIPGFRSINISIIGTPGLTGIMKTPLIYKSGIIGKCLSDL